MRLDGGRRCGLWCTGPDVQRCGDRPAYMGPIVAMLAAMAQCIMPSGVCRVLPCFSSIGFEACAL